MVTRREHIHEPEPCVWLEELYGEPLSAEPSVEDFYRQLEVSVERLSSYGPATDVIAERSPLDFIAYMLALDDLRRGSASEAVKRAITLAADGIAHIDLLIVLPLNITDSIAVPEDEDPELREAMNERLVEIVASDQFDLLGGRSVRVAELEGTPRRRLSELERLIAGTR